MEEPVCGTIIRLESIKSMFYRYLDNVINDIEKKELVGWYLSFGDSSEFIKDWLINSLKKDEELYNIARHLTDLDIIRGKTPPTFRHGDEVEVIVNAKNITYHRGTIYQYIWHFKYKEWYYFIIENNKKVGKRYYERDLRLVKNLDFKAMV